MTRNILLVDDHGVVLDGLKSVIHEKKHLRVKATALSGTAAIQLLQTESFDLMIADYSMPDMNGLLLVKQVRKIAPLMKIIILSMVEDREDIRNMLASGINGYILKKYATQELFHAIDVAINGGSYWCPEACNAMTDDRRQGPSQPNITARELEILQLLAGELTNREIASKLFISERTVETHRKNLLRKTGSGSTVGLIKYAYSLKLI